MNATDIREGMTVYSADGEKLGKVVMVGADRFQIEHGFFFPKEYFARHADILSVNENGDVILRHGRETLAQMGEGESLRSDGEEVRMPLVAEELDVTKHERDAGAVRVSKRVVQETQTVQVPVVREEAVVERVPASAATADVGTLQDETLRVPLREEEVEIRKRPVVREELRVRKERHVEQRAVSENVRHEEADVSDEVDSRRLEREDEPGLQAPSALDPYHRR